MPKVSILMGIYNCASTLEEAISCLQAQTFTDWECILCDDGSTDATQRLAQSLCQKDSRIKLVCNSHNMGLAFALNHCLSQAVGSYIARMDGDDRCPPNRLAVQVSFLEHHPEYAIVSGWMECFDENGTYGLVRYRECPSLENFLRGSQFCHASSMIRKDAILSIGGYRTTPSVHRVEDYDLWIRMYEQGFRGYNLQQVLYQMRDDRNAVNRRKFRYRWNESKLSWHIFRTLHLPLYNLPQTAVPLIKGLLPQKFYQYLHKRKLGE